MSAAKITDARWDAEVLDTDQVVIVSFCAPESSPCRMFRPVIDELAVHLAGRARVLTLEVDANPQATRRYEVSSVPTLLVFRAGRLQARLIGARPKERLLPDLMRSLD